MRVRVSSGNYPSLDCYSPWLRVEKDPDNNPLDDYYIDVDKFDDTLAFHIYRINSNEGTGYYETISFEEVPPYVFKAAVKHLLTRKVTYNETFMEIEDVN